MVMQDPAKCIMHCITSNGVQLRVALEAICPILVEGSISFTEKGMFIKGLNTIILCDMCINASEVEEFICTEQQLIFVNFNTLCSCLSSVAQDESVCFQLTRKGMDCGTPHLSVFIVCDTVDEEYVFSYEVPLLALTRDDFEIPKTKFKSVITMPADKFQRALRCCDKRGDYVQICTRVQENGNFIVFKTDGDDADLMFYMRYLDQVSMNSEEENEGDDDGDKPTSVHTSCFKKDRYSLKYLMLIARASPMSAYATIYLIDDFPLAVRYSIGTVGEVTFCLSPQVDRATFSPPHIEPLSSILSMDMDVHESGGNKDEPNKCEETKEEVANPREREEKTSTSKPKAALVMDDGSTIKRQRRKRKRAPAMPKISGRGSVQGALKFNSNEAGPLMSGTNMVALASGGTVNETLGASRVKKTRVPLTTKKRSTQISKQQESPKTSESTSSALAIDLDSELVLPN